MSVKPIFTYPSPAGFTAFTMYAATGEREHLIQAAASWSGASRYAWLTQVHSNVTHRITGDTPGGLEGDAMVTTETGILLGIFTADCVPVLLMGHGFAAAIHAGWRGFAGNIFASCLDRIKARRSEIHAVIGPAICINCYEVGPEVAAHFSPEEIRDGRDAAHFHVDLPLAAKNRLVQAGLEPGHICLDTHCTACMSPVLPSYRKNATGNRMVTAVMRGPLSP